MFHPMNTLSGASFENIFTGAQSRRQPLLSLFSTFFRGGDPLVKRLVDNSLWHSKNRLEAVAISHESAKSVYKNGFRRVVGAVLPKPNGARASRSQQSRRL